MTMTKMKYAHHWEQVRFAAREMARDFINDYPRPHGNPYREMRFVTLKGILGGLYDYSTEYKRISISPNHPKYEMPHITFIQDIMIPFGRVTMTPVVIQRDDNVVSIKEPVKAERNVRDMF